MGRGEHIDTPSFRLVEGDQENAIEGSSRAESSAADAREDPALDKGKAADARGDQPGGDHIFDSSSARDNFLQFRYGGPGRFYQDKVACGEFVYSVKGAAQSCPGLEELMEKEAYRSFARTHVRNLAQVNDLIASYEDGLAKARKTAEDKDDLIASYEDELAKARKTAEDKEIEAARLRAENEKLKNRLRYLKEIEEPKKRMVQVRGVVKVLEQIKNDFQVDVPEDLTNKLKRDLAIFRDRVDKVAEVTLDDEDLR